MSPDPYISPCLRIHVSASSNLRIFCKIHVSDSCLIASLIIRFCGPAQAKRKFSPPETPFVWPCAGKTVGPSVSRRRHGSFDLPRCIFCGPAQAKRKFDLPRRVLCPDLWIHEESRPDERKSPRRYSETPKKFPSNRFAQAKRKFWPPESRFLWPCAVKNEPNRNLHLDLRVTPTVRTPQCDTLFGEKKV